MIWCLGTSLLFSWNICLLQVNCCCPTIQKKWQWTPLGSSQELKNSVDNFLLSNCSSSINAYGIEPPWCELAWKLLHNPLAKKMRRFSVKEKEQLPIHNTVSRCMYAHCIQEGHLAAEHIQQKTFKKVLWKALLQLSIHDRVDSHLAFKCAMNAMSNLQHQKAS